MYHFILHSCIICDRHTDAQSAVNSLQPLPTYIHREELSTYICHHQHGHHPAEMPTNKSFVCTLGFKLFIRAWTTGHRIPSKAQTYTAARRCDDNEPVGRLDESLTASYSHQRSKLRRPQIIFRELLLSSH